VKERYVPIRPGIAEHLLRGDISAFEFGVYVIVHLQANYSTGIWRGSAPRILNSAPRGAKLREIQRALEHLAELNLLKHFHKHGQRGNFPFLINKFTVRSGALMGMRLNACKSESWQSPVYEACADVDADEHAQDAPIQEGRSKREWKKELRRQKPAPGDSRFQPFLAFAFESFAAKHGRKPIWQGKDHNGLKNLLKNQSAESLPLERLKANWRNFLDSTEAFTVRQGDSLAYYCANVDKFSDGPILAAPGRGTNGKPTATDLALRNARALGLGGRPN